MSVRKDGKGPQSKCENKRSVQQKELDAVTMISLFRRGWTAREIGTKLGVSREQINQDFKRVMRASIEERGRDVELIRTVKLEELAEVKREAWKAWDRSQMDAQRLTEEEALRKVETDGGEGGEPKNGKRKSGRVQPSGPQTTEGRLKFELLKVRQVKVTEGQTGDPRYLDIIERCIRKESELLGADLPRKVDLSVELSVWDVLAGEVPRDQVIDVQAKVMEAIEHQAEGEDEGGDE